MTSEIVMPEDLVEKLVSARVDDVRIDGTRLEISFGHRGTDDDDVRLAVPLDSIVLLPLDHG